MKLIEQARASGIQVRLPRSSERGPIEACRCRRSVEGLRVVGKLGAHREAVSALPLGAFLSYYERH